MHNNGTRLAKLTLALALGLSAGHAQAEQLTIPVGSQAERSEVSMPANGMSQDAVKNRWGSPQDIREAVGQPPITQWHYQEFVVYFENNRVLHTVLKRQP